MNTVSFKKLSTEKSVYLLLACSLLTTLLFWMEGHLGINMADEGYLWYGAKQVIAGEVPIRDFMSYDPGRYYWTAAFMKLFGNDGIIVSRIAEAVFQTLGLFLATMLIFKSSKKKNIIFMIFSSIILLLWMTPYYKTFDTTSSVALLFLLTIFIERPTNYHAFITGIGVGLIALFGRNHGLYGAFGSLYAISLLSLKKENTITFLSACIWWACGVIIGYLPLLLSFIFVPGLAHSFWDGVVLLFQVKTTNNPLPIPWPWNAVSINELCLGLLFVSILIFSIIGSVFVIIDILNKRKASPILVACICLAFPYAHYAFSRADTVHLAFGIFPFFIGILVILVNKSNIIKTAALLILLEMTIAVILPIHYAFLYYVYGDWKKIQISSGEFLTVNPYVARKIKDIDVLINKYAPNGEAILSVPFSTTVYPLFNRKSPIWEIYSLFPRSKQFQEAEIQRIKYASPKLVFIDDYVRDDREDLRYQYTHKLIYQYICENYEMVKPYSIKNRWLVFRMKDKHSSSM